MLKAVTSKTRTEPVRSARTMQVDDLSASKLFNVANKAQENGVEAMKSEYERKIALLTARAEIAESRANRENKRCHQTTAQLNVALIRADKAEQRCNELVNAQVSDVLKFILKNSNTAGKKMTDVRPN